MHAVVVVVDIEAGRAEEAAEMLHAMVVPAVRQEPGFVSGTWVRSADGAHGQGIVVFESEAAATAAAVNAAEGLPPGAPVKQVSVTVFEVLVQA